MMKVESNRLLACFVSGAAELICGKYDKNGRQSGCWAL